MRDSNENGEIGGNEKDGVEQPLPKKRGRKPKEIIVPDIPQESKVEIINKKPRKPRGPNKVKKDKVKKERKVKRGKRKGASFPDGLGRWWMVGRIISGFANCFCSVKLPKGVSWAGIALALNGILAWVAVIVAVAK